MSDPRLEAGAEALHSAMWSSDPNVHWPCEDETHLDGECNHWFRLDAAVCMNAMDRIDPLRDSFVEDGGYRGDH